MLIEAERIEMWSGNLKDEPGAVAGTLGKLSEAGADLQFVLARRKREKPGEGVLFVSEIKGDAQVEAARAAGLEPVEHFASVRVEGPDEPGLAHRMTEAFAGAGLNLRGISAGRIGKRCFFFIACDTAEEADRAVEIAREIWYPVWQND